MRVEDGGRYGVMRPQTSTPTSHASSVFFLGSTQNMAESSWVKPNFLCTIFGAVGFFFKFWVKKLDQCLTRFLLRIINFGSSLENILVGSIVRRDW